ncbi:hypothetical protein UA08_06645 [Talaromyces atroroseus]|uniref:Saccharopine dehydrogenase NADP binding domain-containing protein n=1 Tax=Talaromyces atroroseus TaxID=1441469 RepID=A0A225ASJ6_TALAT|nr:hypothetical protein UA08_06645 [Talaromyces atroroseus]OKL57926.1 hypothetical protein UA08_06645 [Talaromyces atroroseus]
MSKEFDLILLGPTGYTGAFVAEHICKSFPTTLKWAVAGRSASKIQSVLEQLKTLGLDRADPDVLTVQLTPDELDALAKRTRLIVNCVGPYHLYSTPVVESCAENGTHYIDVSGETPWIRRVLQKYHKTAEKNGAIIVPSCGFESVPPDIVAWVAVDFLRTKLSAEPVEAVGCLYDFRSAGVSGGTAYSILSTLEGANISEMLSALDSYCLSATPTPPTRITPRKSIAELICGVRAASDLGTLTTVPSRMADESTVLRSSTLMPDLYGPRFSYGQYLRVRNVFLGTIFHLAFNSIVCLLVFAPIRWLFRKILPAPGGGPSKDETVNDYCEHRILISSDQRDETGRPTKALGSIAYQGGQYDLTGLTAAAAAKVVLNHEKEIKDISAGFVTSATLGQPYVDELEKGNV